MSKRNIWMFIAAIGAIASFVSMTWAVVDDHYLKAFYFLTCLFINSFGYYMAKESTDD